MTTDTPAAAASTAERKLLQRCRDGFWAEHLTGLPVLEKWRKETISLLDAALSTSVAAQPAASGVDAIWVHRLRETAAHLRGNSLSLAKYPGMGKEARARELAALYIGEIADLYALRDHLSAALTGAAIKDRTDP